MKLGFFANMVGADEEGYHSYLSGYIYPSFYCNIFPLINNVMKYLQSTLEYIVSRYITLMEYSPSTAKTFKGKTGSDTNAICGSQSHINLLKLARYITHFFACYNMSNNMVILTTYQIFKEQKCTDKFDNNKKRLNKRQ